MIFLTYRSAWHKHVAARELCFVPADKKYNIKNWNMPAKKGVIELRVIT
jgi:hypothetical protein